MRLFPPRESEYFCANARFGGTVDPISLYFSKLGGSRAATITVKEGTPEFDEYRNTLLCDADRKLFLAASNYRRALDLMTVSSCVWAHVTLYYASFFSASALIQMHGAYVDAPHTVAEVSVAKSGAQEINLYLGKGNTKIKALSGGVFGSHRTFWSMFYSSFSSIVNLVPQGLQEALRPVSRNSLWQIETRNKLNYQSYDALEMMGRFKKVFSRGDFPASLPGEINTQFVVTELLLKLAFVSAKKRGLKTIGLDMLGGGIGRNKLIQQYVCHDQRPDIFFGKRLQKARAI